MFTRKRGNEDNTVVGGKVNQWVRTLVTHTHRKKRRTDTVWFDIRRPLVLGKASTNIEAVIDHSGNEYPKSFTHEPLI